MLTIMSKVSKQLKTILEYIWLTTAIISIGIASYETYQTSLKSAVPFFAFFFLALFFYVSRRKERIKNN